MQATMDDLTPLEAKPKPARKRAPKATPTQAATALYSGERVW